MEKGEIWVSDFWDGRNGALIGDSIEKNVWECKYLIKVSATEYAFDAGGRRSSRIDPSEFYTGEGQLFEDMFSKFYHKVTGIRIVPKPSVIPVTTSNFSDLDDTNYTVIEMP